jgi:hypothetical protein
MNAFPRRGPVFVRWSIFPTATLSHVEVGVNFKPWLFVLFPLIFTASTSAQTIARVDQPMKTATFVNIYWASSWDADNPTLPMTSLDETTRAMFSSSYFAGLAEYGVASVTFAGRLTPDMACTSKAPSKVGFYDPIAPSISGFIKCEHDNGPPLLQQSDIVYNILLPPSSIESDLFSANFCNGPGSPGGWHYGLPDFPFALFTGGPVYTIVMSNPRCGMDPTLPISDGFLSDMFHEMVEALTDPFPIDISVIPPHISVSSFHDEIADVPCGGRKDVMIFRDSTGASPLSGGILKMGVPSYWSNARQLCENFADITFPSITNIALTGWGSQTGISITGTGFGTFPGSSSSEKPYAQVRSASPAWSAGDSINGDTINVGGTWSPSQIGINLFPGTVNNVPDVPLTVWICNPNSLNCVSHIVLAAPGPYNPRFQINNVVHGVFSSPDTFKIMQGNQLLFTQTVSGTCNTCMKGVSETLAPGAYNFSETVTGKIPLDSVENGCAAVTLALGEETGCAIVEFGPVKPCTIIKNHVVCN